MRYASARNAPTRPPTRTRETSLSSGRGRAGEEWRPEIFRATAPTKRRPPPLFDERFERMLPLTIAARLIGGGASSPPSRLPPSHPHSTRATVSSVACLMSLVTRRVASKLAPTPVADRRGDLGRERMLAVVGRTHPGLRPPLSRGERRRSCARESRWAGALGRAPDRTVGAGVIATFRALNREQVPPPNCPLPPGARAIFISQWLPLPTPQLWPRLRA